MSNKRGRKGGQNKREDRRSLLNLIDMGVKINGGEGGGGEGGRRWGVGILRCRLISVTDEKREINV